MSINPTRATVSGVITSAGYNQLVDAIMTPPICRVSTTVAQATSATANTNTAVQFNQNTYDPSSMHSTTTNNTRITIPAGWGGFYAALGCVRLVNGTPSCVVQFAINGVVYGSSAMRQYGTASQGAITRTNDDMLLNAGDYVELYVQSDTASVSLIPANCMFALRLVHP